MPSSWSSSLRFLVPKGSGEPMTIALWKLDRARVDGPAGLALFKPVVWFLLVVVLAWLSPGDE